MDNPMCLGSSKLESFILISPPNLVDLLLDLYQYSDLDTNLAKADFN